MCNHLPLDENVPDCSSKHHRRRRRRLRSHSGHRLCIVTRAHSAAQC